MLVSHNNYKMENNVMLCLISTFCNVYLDCDTIITYNMLQHGIIKCKSAVKDKINGG